MSATNQTERLPEAPSILVGGGHLAALWALAIVQPLLSLLGSNPDFFVARDNTGGQIIVFAILVTVAPPVAAMLVEALLNPVSRRARWGLHLALVGILFGLLVVQIFKQFADGPAIPILVTAAVAGAGLAWAYGYRDFVRSLTDLLIPAPLVILIVFVFFSDASELTTRSPDVQPIEASVGNPAPVVMLVFDEFPVGSLMTPDRRINARRFPNFAELERNATWYRNTVTDASYTAIAVPSILTGTSADRDSLPTAADHPDSVFTLLGGSYRVRAAEPITQLCPTSVCVDRKNQEIGMTSAQSGLYQDLKYVSAHLTLPESMAAGLPDISQSFEGFGGNPAESVERGRARQFVRDRLDERESAIAPEVDLDQMLRDRQPAAESTFDFAHVEVPHYPWTHYPDGRSYTQRTEDFRGFFNETAWLDDGYVSDRARQAHLLQVGYADHMLGRVIDRIKRDGLWDDTMLVVAADHGGAMTKGLHRREATPRTMGEIALVPFFVKAPGQRRGRTVNRTTCVAEIVPIMVAELGVKPPWESPDCDRDLVSIDNGTGPVVTSPAATVRRQRDRYIATLAKLFGGSSGWDAVFSLGPNQDLLGTPAAALDADSARPGESAEPDLGNEAESEFDPELSLNPVLRQRGVLSGVSEDAPLAVSVNGRVAAVGRSYREGDVTRYSILLPEDSLRPGRNQIRLYLIADGAGRPDPRLLWTNSNQ